MGQIKFVNISLKVYCVISGDISTEPSPSIILPFEADVYVSRLSMGVHLVLNWRVSYYQYNLLPQLELLPSFHSKNVYSYSLMVLITNPQKQCDFSFYSSKYPNVLHRVIG